MYHEKLVTGLFLSMILIGAASAVSICPFDPLEPQEAGISYSEGAFTNGGTVTGFLFGTSESVFGINHTNTTATISTSNYLIGKGVDMKYAADHSVMSDASTSETGISVNRGRINYGESVFYSGTKCENPQYCEQMYSGVDVMLTNGTFGSSMSMLGTTLLNHESAVIGTGSFSGTASYGVFQGENSTISSFGFTKDSIGMVGTMEFGRKITFKSIKP